MRISKWFLRASAMAALSVAGQAQAVTFNLTDVGGAAIGTQARMGFEIATAYWSSVLVNSNVTVNLNIGFSQLAARVLGSTSSASSVNFNSQVYNALATHVTSTIDAQAVASLRPLTTTAYGVTGLTAITNAFNANGDGYVDTSTRIDNDGSINNVAVAVNKSVDKALGITTDANGRAINYNTADGSITFSNQYNFDFNPEDGVSANAIDFIGVAIHEIGHALGFRSGVDVYDAYTSPGAANTNPGGLEGSVVSSELDYFRYSSAGNLDWSTQNTPYFSINGGLSQLFGDSRFSTGVANGDGNQASHWKDNDPGELQLGVMDPTVAYGQMQQITGLDIAAFDTLGWKTAFDASTNPTYRFTTADAYNAFASSVHQVAVPEPATWGMMILGFGFAGSALRVRRRQAAVRLAA